ncbi:IS110 family transposase [Arthrobacter sp. CAU 1506]|nr:IS110 family transposase [Arthrobacter sp. CAU 1506]
METRQATVCPWPSKPARSPRRGPPIARPGGLRHQPYGDGPVPRPARGLTQETRCPGRPALANILCTDRHAHRPLPRDSELVQDIAVLVRAQQDVVWDRQQHANRIRSLLREYHPSALKALTTVTVSRAPLVVLWTPKPPEEGCPRELTSPQRRTLRLRVAGRIERETRHVSDEIPATCLGVS